MRVISGDENPSPRVIVVSGTPFKVARPIRSDNNAGGKGCAEMNTTVVGGAELED